MFKYWKKIDELHHINRILLATILALMLVISGLTLALITAPKRFEFWLTPQMAANGGLMKASDIPNEYVQGFVSTLLPLINTWESEDDFLKHLQEFHYYFTPHYQNLMKHMSSAFKDAQLFERTQIASIYRFMEPSDIRRIGKDRWEVHLTLRLTQRLNAKNPMLIADKVVDYFIQVVKTNGSKLQNPFELALDGFVKPEALVFDFLSGEDAHEDEV